MRFDAATIRALGLEEPELLRLPLRRWQLCGQEAPAALSPVDGNVWMDRAGLERLTYAAQQEVEAAGIKLPHNLWKHGGAVGEPSMRPFRAHPSVIEEYARFAGWLHALARAQKDHPARVYSLRRCILKCTSPNGVCSPRTRLSLWELALRGSPEYLSHRLGRVRARAAEILRPWALTPSWEQVAYTVTYSPGATGRSAVLTAARCLGGRVISYRDARAHLAKAAGLGAAFATLAPKPRHRAARNLDLSRGAGVPTLVGILAPEWDGHDLMDDHARAVLPLAAAIAAKLRN